MGTTLDVVNEWASDSEEKQTTVKTRSGLVLRWMNQAQLRFAEKSECLRGEWQPTITSTGNVALVSDFIREFPDLVKYNLSATVNPPLIKIDYWEAVNVSFSGTTHYSIFNGSLYVWAASALTPSIPYVKKPTVITALTTADLSIPTEFHRDLIPYLDFMWQKTKLSLGDQLLLMKQFDNQAGLDGLKFKTRQDGMFKMRSNRF